MIESAKPNIIFSRANLFLADRRCLSARNRFAFGGIPPDTHFVYTCLREFVSLFLIFRLYGLASHVKIKLSVWVRSRHGQRVSNTV